MIDCREAVRRMWAYLDHELDAKPVSEFEVLLAGGDDRTGQPI